MYNQYYPDQNKIPMTGFPQDYSPLDVLKTPPQPNLATKSNSQNLTYSSNTHIADKLMKVFSPQKTPTNSTSGGNFRQSIGSTGPSGIKYGEGSPSNQLGIPERYRSDVEFNFMLSQLLQQMIGDSQNVRQIENQTLEKGIGGIGSGFGG